MRKGSALAYSGILAMLLMATFVFIYMAYKDPITASIISSEGKLISFVNNAELLLKTFDTSVEFISQRAAYELGRNGGMEDAVYWSKDYPTMSVLERELEKTIIDNLPNSAEAGTFQTLIKDGDVDVSYSSECGPIFSSECFFVDGEVYISFYDNDTISRIILDPHEFDLKIPSNYFKLLNAGRKIFEDYSDLLGDRNLLTNTLNGDPQFGNLHFSSILVGSDIVELTIEERCYPPETYCIAPLRTIETNDFDASIPYDYVKLVITYNAEQTGFTEPDYIFSLYVNPFRGRLVC